MSYYFTILSPTDVPIFNIVFGTAKSGGDGIARFRFPDSGQNTNTYMTQFIIHSSLDMLEEAQWMNGNLYLKHIDTYPPASAYISAFLTPSGTRFVLLHQPPKPNLPSSNSVGGGLSGSMSMSSSGVGSSGLFGGAGSSGRTSSSSIAANPTSPQTEEAVRQFMTEVYENYVKTVMSPFYQRGMKIKSPVFRGKVSAAGRKWL